MTQEEKTTQFRNSLSDIEQQTYDAFVKSEGAEPQSMWQLMQYGAIMQQQAKEFSKFWKGVLGL